MGKIITRGYAEREVTCNHMSIIVDFYTREKHTKDAVRKVTDECENFLKELKDAGMDISQIEAGSNSISKGRYRDDDLISANREICIEMPYNLRTLDYIMDLAQSNSYSADITVSTSFDGANKLHKELLKEATENARKKADLMSQATGTKIVGVGRIQIERYYDVFDDEEDDDIDAYNEGIKHSCALSQNLAPSRLYSDLKASTTTETEEVYIEWILE